MSMTRIKHLHKIHENMKTIIINICLVVSCIHISVLPMTYIQQTSTIPPIGLSVIAALKVKSTNMLVKLRVLQSALTKVSEYWLNVVNRDQQNT